MNLGALAVVSVREREIGGPVFLGDLRGLGRDHPLLAAGSRSPCSRLRASRPPAASSPSSTCSARRSTRARRYLAVIGVIGTMISLGYYLRFLLAIYAPAGQRGRPRTVPGTRLAATAVLVSAAVVLWLGVAPQPLVDVARTAAASLVAAAASSRSVELLDSGHVWHHLARSRLLPDRHARRRARPHRPRITGNPSWPEGRAVDAATRSCSPTATATTPPTRPRGAGALGSGRDDPRARELAGGQGVAEHHRLQQGRHDRDRRRWRDDDERRALLSAPDGTRSATRPGFVIEGTGMPTIYAAGDTAVHADMDLIGELYTPVDRDPADRRPLHDGSAARRPTRSAARLRPRSCRPLRHVRAADRHARRPARGARAHRRRARSTRSRPGEIVRAFADLLDRRLRPRTRRQWASRSPRSSWPSARSCRGSRPASARSRRRRSPNTAYGPDGLRCCATAERARGSRPAARADRAATTARPGSSTPGARRDAHRRELHAWAGGRDGPGYAAQGNILAGPESSTRWPRPSSEQRALADGSCSRWRRATPPAATGAAASRPRWRLSRRGGYGGNDDTPGRPARRRPPRPGRELRRLYGSTCC